MEKCYYEYINEITKDELYSGLLGFGLFSTSLPPLFSSIEFYEFCNERNPSFNKKTGNDYVSFLAMRNVNIPRPISIPTPMKYQILCEELKCNWDKIQDYFYDLTRTQAYKVSRIHIRKRFDKKGKCYFGALFEMNYHNWSDEDSVEDNLLLTPINNTYYVSKYVVKADISSCFPSIYTHSLPWALVGKEEAKKHKRMNIWYNKIDEACRNTKNGETHGLLIGPHCYNLLAEIVLTDIDRELYELGFRFFRNIDDYTCYVSSYEQAQQFLFTLEKSLASYGLLLNHKKTTIEELPAARTNHWIRQLQSIELVNKEGYTTYTQVNTFLDLAVKLADDNNDAAILNYAIKVLSRLNDSLSNNAKKSVIKRVLHLALLYPYLVKLLDEYIFNALSVDKEDIISFSEALYNTSLTTNHYEGLAYSFLFAIKYNFKLNVFSIENIKDTDDCIALLCTLLYAKKNNYEDVIDSLKTIADNINNNDEFNKYWLFCYEVLSEDVMDEDWRLLKKNGITFIRSEYLS